jgi:hypothetical protein
MYTYPRTAAGGSCHQSSCYYPPSFEPGDPRASTTSSAEPTSQIPNQQTLKVGNQYRNGDLFLDCGLLYILTAQMFLGIN